MRVRKMYWIRGLIVMLIVIGLFFAAGGIALTSSVESQDIE
jgi:hypothetical protein